MDDVGDFEFLIGPVVGGMSARIMCDDDDEEVCLYHRTGVCIQ